MFLYVLVRDLEFSIDPAVEIEKKVKYVPPCSPSLRARWRYVLTDLVVFLLFLEQCRDAAVRQVRAAPGEPDAAIHPPRPPRTRTRVSLIVALSVL